MHSVCVRAAAFCHVLSGLAATDISSVEVLGGSTRVPAVFNLVQEVFGLTPSRTLNAKEVVSRGAALQCAMISPLIKVRGGAGAGGVVQPADLPAALTAVMQLRVNARLKEHLQQPITGNACIAVCQARTCPFACCSAKYHSCVLVMFALTGALAAARCCPCRCATLTCRTRCRTASRCTTRTRTGSPRQTCCSHSTGERCICCWQHAACGCPCCNMSCFESMHAPQPCLV